MSKEIDWKLLVAALKVGNGKPFSGYLTSIGSKVNMMVTGEDIGRVAAEAPAPAASALSFLGAAAKGKDLVMGIISREKEEAIVNDFNQAGADAGMVVTFNVNYFAHPVTGELLSGENEEEDQMSKSEHDLVIAIMEPGHSSMVMDTARAAGAQGGTLVNGNGVSQQTADDDDDMGGFVSEIPPSEKDMLFIVAKKEAAALIVSAIAMEHGIETDTKAIVFSLPINNASGVPSAN